MLFRSSGERPYCDVTELLNSLEHYGLNPSDNIVQQDNDSKHTSKEVKEWLEEQDFRTMVWPAQSPDLNH